MRLIALAAALAVGLAIAWLQAQPPADAGQNAPAEAFSASRALADVKVIAAEPHPTGSLANAKARDHLLARLKDLGLAPEVRPTVGVTYTKAPGEVALAAGAVENVLAVIPGRDRQAPALLLMAHYDSVPRSPGAADDAAGSAAILEIARAMKARGQPERDVILLFTDGEEAGLLGASGFFRADPLVRRIGFVINLEARGSAGLANMFETGRGNGAVVARFRRHFVSPASSALSVFVYERLPNDTDFTPAKAAGLAGLNYAFMGRQFDYHSPTSTWQTLDIGSLQDLGAKGLGAAAQAAYAPALPAKTPDVAYSTLLGPIVVAYPPAAGWLVLALTAGLIALAAWRARGEGRLVPVAVLQGAGASLFILLLAATALRLLGHAAGEAASYVGLRALLARFHLFEAAVGLAAVAVFLLALAALARGRMRLATAVLALAMGAASSLFGGFDPVGLGLGAAAALLGALILARPPAPPAAWLGVLLVAFALVASLQIAFPLIAFLPAWPLLPAVVVAAVTGLGARPSRLGWALAFAAAVLVGAWLIGLSHALLVGVGLAEGVALAVWLALPVLWAFAPQAASGRAPLLAAGLLALGAVAAVAFIALVPPWSPRYPRHEAVLYVQNADTGAALRVSAARPPGPWGKAVLAADGGKTTPRRVEPLYTVELPTAPAKPVAAPPPEITLARVGDRVRLTIAPPPGSNRMIVTLKATVALSAADLNGAPLERIGAPGHATRMSWVGRPEPMVLTFKPAGPGRLDLAYAAANPAWPAGAKPLPPIAADEMQIDISGSTVVTGTRRLGW